MKHKFSDVIDRISGLPDQIIHIIMLNLSTKDATRTTVLSKRFRSAWDSFPVLDFNSTYSRNWSTVSGKHQFLEYMQGCIQRRAKNLGLLKFRLYVDAVLLDPIFRATDEAIIYAIANKVRELDLTFNKYKSNSHGYSLQSSLISAMFSANTVTVLKLAGLDLKSLDHVNFPSIEEMNLRGCDMGNNLKISSDRLKIVELLGCVGISHIDVCSSNLTTFSYQLKKLSNECDINLTACKSLKKLILKKVGLTSECLKANVSMLVLLENLKLGGCDKFEDICITSPSLKTLEIHDFKRLKKIVVVAVNLDSFVFRTHNVNSECDIKVADCLFLKVLDISNARITDSWVEKTVSKLQFLKHLKLSACFLLRKIRVHHGALKCLKLIHCINLREVEFHCRTLTSFNYIGEGIHSNFCINSPVLEADLYINGGFLVIPYKELRDFLGFFDHCKSLSISGNSIQWLIFPKDLRERLLPPLSDIKHLTIGSSIGSSICSTVSDNIIELVDALLWLSPHIETITFASSYIQNKSLKLEYVNIEAFEEEGLLGKEDQLCCQTLLIKCWRHFMKKVSMENFETSDQRKLRNYFRHEAISCSISLGASLLPVCLCSVLTVQVEKKVKTVSFHLDREALQWFQWENCTKKLSNWEDFIKAFCREFGPHKFEDFTEPLFKLRQTGALKDYKSEFRRLDTRIGDLSPSFHFSCFIGGLKEELKHEVKLLRPSTVQKEMIYDVEVDLKLHNCRSFSNAKSKFFLPPIRTENIIKAESATKDNLPIIKLTSEEIQYKRQNNLYFYCNEKFAKGHKCVGKQILLLDLGYSSVEEEEIMQGLHEQEPEQITACCITTGVLFDTSSPQVIKTMKDMAYIKNYTMIVLFDSGSSHNFLDDGLVRKLSLVVDASEIFDLMIGNGGQVKSKGACTATTHKIDQYIYTYDMLILPLGGCDIVLGIQWLRILGPILWDFEKLSMEF
ncbi:hypothetical protein Ddye_018497 [Dipteronia dyeriana]|uniref:F-box domain-containing protein n=1 Tax=Dipteronia dyeriana TaxID=168575 RepID=A0AAD9UBC4_9ROSI|nr:hypothetical protein Ddye_018497 [Dipteronia dyeriana]